MTIEQKLLRLAEAATPGPWTAVTIYPDRGEVFGPDGDHFLMCHVPAGSDGDDHANVRLIAALDPPTVSRLARVVEAARECERDSSFIDRLAKAGFVNVANHLTNLVLSLADLDAEQEGAE